MPVLFHDFETGSPLPLNDVGAWRYATCPDTRVWCCAYAVDDGPVKLWLPGDPVPPEFVQAASDPAWITSAFNDQFERYITMHIMGPRYGWRPVPIERRRCTQAASLTLALPATLEKVAAALSLAQQKDTEGRKAMLQLAKPRKRRKGEPEGVYWHDTPENLDELHAYCRQDVETERAIYHRVGHLSEAEQALWQLDAKINERGIYLDGALIDAALRIANQAKHKIAEDIRAVTGGAIISIDQRDKLLAWLNERGCALPNMQKATLAQALERDDLSEEARYVIDLRAGGAQAAANKIRTMRDWRNEDGRARGTLRYHGASTGRWSAGGIQTQNMKKPTVDVAEAIEHVVTGDERAPLSQHKYSASCFT
jgi:DNA polymerase